MIKICFCTSLSPFVSNPVSVYRCDHFLYKHVGTETWCAAGFFFFFLSIAARRQNDTFISLWHEIEAADTHVSVKLQAHVTLASCGQNRGNEEVLIAKMCSNKNLCEQVESLSSKETKKQVRCFHDTDSCKDLIKLKEEESWGIYCHTFVPRWGGAGVIQLQGVGETLWTWHAACSSSPECPTCITVTFVFLYQAGLHCRTMEAKEVYNKVKLKAAEVRLLLFPQCNSL